MALTSGSKILVSDISTALGGKIDTAGTGLSKSGTTLALASLHSAASTIGSSSAQTLSYSGTFTIPYVTRDVYGRVSGGGTRTITMPTKPSGGTADALSGFAIWEGYWGSSDKKCYGTGTFSKGGAVVGYQNVYTTKWTAPAGGTWIGYGINPVGGSSGGIVKQIAGGNSLDYWECGMAIRIA